MQIIEIEEPDVSSDRPQEIIVGIDFGTTNSLVAIAEDSNVRFFKTESGSDLLPSIVSISRKDNKSTYWSVGGMLGNGSCIRSVKRLLAKSYQEIADSSVLNTLIDNCTLIDEGGRPHMSFDSVNDKNYSIPYISSKIFQSLKESVLQELNSSDDISLKAVISVPAYFNDAERGQVTLAAKYAGIEVLRLIPEPTAAAYAYGLNKKVKGTYLVYDLGGGTFDVAILNMSEGVLQVIACGGDNNLGGDDIDFAIAQYLASRLDKKAGELGISPKLIAEAKQLKHVLSKNHDHIIEIDDEKVTVTRDNINVVIGNLIDQTIKIAANTYFDAETPDLDGIILVGGSTRIPLIKNKLQQKFSTKIYSSIDPDKAVACGAALQAENLATNKGNLLIDVVPLSVGLELYGGLFEKIILRNTPLPFSVSKEFTTQADFQTGMNFHVLQGEREMSADCRSLAHFELKDLPSKKASMVKVEVQFAMDADGILSVTANEVGSDKVVNIICRPGYGLTEEQITADLENAYSHAMDDHEKRLMTEMKIEAQELIGGLKVALQQTPDVISDVEYNEINDRIGDLENAVTNAKNIKDRDSILLKMQELNDNSARFIERHLNLGADKIIVGKNIKDLEKKI